jgi:hypothetical protein
MMPRKFTAAQPGTCVSSRMQQRTCLEKPSQRLGNAKPVDGSGRKLGRSSSALPARRRTPESALASRRLRFGPRHSKLLCSRKASPSGRGSAWLERLLREQEAGGSNPLAPTILFNHLSGCATQRFRQDVKSGQRIPVSSHLRCRCPRETSRSCSIPASGTDNTDTDTSLQVLRLARASRRPVPSNRSQ